MRNSNSQLKMSTREAIIAMVNECVAFEPVKKEVFKHRGTQAHIVQLDREGKYVHTTKIEWNAEITVCGLPLKEWLKSFNLECMDSRLIESLSQDFTICNTKTLMGLDEEVFKHFTTALGTWLYHENLPYAHRKQEGELMSAFLKSHGNFIHGALNVDQN